MKKTLFFLCLLFSNFTISQAQIDNLSQHQKEVILPIQQLFEGMLKGDSSMVRQAFHENSILRTIGKDKNGKIILRTDSLASFLQAVATPHEQVYQEKVLSYDIKIDDNLAQVWTPYEFYLGDTFSHCGVNAFHLMNTEKGWKIIAITDTRRREDCK